MEEQVIEAHDDMEFLIELSRQGFHVLFESEDILQILNATEDNKDLFKMETLDRVQNLMNEFVSSTSLSDKADFLSNLDKESYSLLVRSYFNILENAILSDNQLH